MNQIHILGRQPRISLAELEAKVGSNNVTPLLPCAALSTNSIRDLDSLGGIIKSGEIFQTINSTNWNQIFKECQNFLKKYITVNPVDGKFTIGISVYGRINVSLRSLQASTLELKKIVKKQGISARAIQNKELVLSSAQVIHNKLTSKGVEFVIVEHKKQVYIAKTIHIQNIDEYSRRDFNRPKRDAFVGMLPPKLAQIMLNLAQVKANDKVLDPFCGTGVVLQEAALMGCTVYGTDKSEKMVDYTKTNLEWLKEKYNLEFNYDINQADATEATWPSVDSVVCETYLGQPLSGLPSSEKLSQIIQTCDLIVKKFLTNLQPQLKPGAKCTIAIPAWNVKNSFKRLKVVDQLDDLGYNRISFKHVSSSDLIYHRSDQIVARELIVLEVK